MTLCHLYMVFKKYFPDLHTAMQFLPVLDVWLKTFSISFLFIYFLVVFLECVGCYAVYTLETYISFSVKKRNCIIVPTNAYKVKW